MIGNFYSTYDATPLINEPVFVRTRQPYRGVKQSVLLNQEIMSFLFDIRRLNDQTSQYRQDLTANFMALETGATFANISKHLSGTQTVNYNLMEEWKPLGNITLGNNTYGETTTDTLVYNNGTIQSSVTEVDGIELLCLRTQRLLDRINALETLIG